MMSFGNRFSVVAALSLGPAVSNSFARFAYALMLPAMRADLGLNYSQAGALNTANAIGYLGGALFAARYVSAGEPAAVLHRHGRNRHCDSRLGIDR